MGILVVGSTHVDFYITTRRLPQPGETVRGTAFFTRPGGKGANQAVGCSRLGARTYLVSAVGGDHLGELALGALRSAGVICDYVHVDELAHTGTAFIILGEESGENMIVVAPGADMSLRPEHVERALSKVATDVKLVLAQLEVPVETVRYALRRGKEVGAKTILNPAPAHAIDEELLEHSDVVTPNRVEASQIAKVEVRDVEAAYEAGEVILSRGPEAVVITLGGLGAAVITRGLRAHVPAYRVRVVDSVGAGDAFNAGLAVALLEGRSILEAVRFACAVAAIKVTRVGAQSVPSRPEVEDFMRSCGAAS